MLTTSFNPEDESKASRIGYISSYRNKPLTQEIILGILKNILAGGSRKPATEVTFPGDAYERCHLSDQPPDQLLLPSSGLLQRDIYFQYAALPIAADDLHIAILHFYPAHNIVQANTFGFLFGIEAHSIVFDHQVGFFAGGL